MDDVTRREVVGVTGLAGVMAMVGLTPGVASADDEPKPAFDGSAEKKRMMTCGFTEAEAECWLQIAKAAGTFFKLPELHPMDKQEVATAIHVVQNKLLARPTYRQYLKLAKGEKK